MKVVGIDVGATKIKGMVINEKREILLTKSVITAEGTEIKSNIVKCLKEMLREHKDISKVGIVSFGIVNDKTGIIEELKVEKTKYSGTNLFEVIRGVIDVPVFAQNDVNGALIGEIGNGIGRNIKNAVFLALGTGVGGANLIDGKIDSGNDFIGGEYGHTILYPNGIQCTCGNKGCVQQYLSGTALHRRLKDVYGYDISDEEISKLNKEDNIFYKVMMEYIKDLAIVIYNIDRSINPEIVIIGGGVSDLLRGFENEINNELKERGVKCKFNLASLGNKAGMYRCS